MPTPTFQPPQGPMDTAQLQDWIIKLIRDLNFMLGNLDTLNVNRLDAKVIIAQTITALQIAANTITADKLSVSQLSAIAADMGTLTAGIIYGDYIATSNGTYPRTEMSTVGNLFAAYQAANSFVKINPAASSSNPGLNFQNGSAVGFIYQFLTDLFIATPIGSGAANIQISSGKDLFLSANGNLQIDGTVGWTGAISVTTPTGFGIISVHKGIITNFA